MTKTEKWGVWAAFLFCALAAITSPAQTLRTLAEFNGTNGESPSSSLVQGFDGNMYGTTQSGGAYGYGTVFKVNARGQLTTLYSFCSQSGCADGRLPNGELIQAPDGNFYGTTVYGGDFSCTSRIGCGTVFKITAGGSLTTLHSFDSNEGDYPLAGLIQATDGNFYGTANEGGANGFGTVFKISASGTVTTLYSFCPQLGCPDGVYPAAALAQGSDRNFYGTTSVGAASNAGTLFKITSAGEFTTLHTFDGYDGTSPTATLVQLGQALYGTTSQGGTSSGIYGSGTVFRIAGGGKLTTLHNFCFYEDCFNDQSNDGSYPYASLVQATDGDFYGTTMHGGYSCYIDPYGCGTVFQITPTGAFATLYTFCTQSDFCSDGAWPQGGLVQATNGTLYGTTTSMAASGYGTVFSLSMGLAPFVAMNPDSGKVGWQINILGDNLTDTTSVTFSGLSAKFTVVSATHIKAIVPATATTGTIQVTTPSGTLSSNVPFHVLP